MAEEIIYEYERNSGTGHRLGACYCAYWTEFCIVEEAKMSWILKWRHERTFLFYIVHSFMQFWNKDPKKKVWEKDILISHYIFHFVVNFYRVFHKNCQKLEDCYSAHKKFYSLRLADKFCWFLAILILGLWIFQNVCRNSFMSTI